MNTITEQGETKKDLVLFLLVVVLSAFGVGLLISLGFGRPALMMVLVVYAIPILYWVQVRTWTIMMFLLACFPIYISFMEDNYGTILTNLSILSFLILCLERILHKKNIFKTPFKRKLFLFAAVTILPFLVSMLMARQGLMGSCLRMAWGYLANISLFGLVLMAVDNRNDFITLCKFFIPVSLIFCSCIIFQYIFPDIASTLFNKVFAQQGILYAAHEFPSRSGEIMRRARGALTSYELSAEMMAISAIFSFAQFLTHKSFQKVKFGVIGLIFFMVMFMTVTRGAFVSLVIGIIYLLYIGTNLRLITLGKALWILLIAISIIAMSIALFNPARQLFLRLGDTEFIGYIPKTRYDIWVSCWEQIVKRPLFGYGLHRHTDLQYGGDPHSLPLHLFHAGGFFALVFFALFIFYLLFQTRLSIVRSLPNVNKKTLGYILGLKTTLIIFLVDQIKITYFRDENFQHWIWILFGLLGSLAVILQKRQKMDHNFENQSWVI